MESKFECEECCLQSWFFQNINTEECPECGGMMFYTGENRDQEQVEQHVLRLSKDDY